MSRNARLAVFVLGVLLSGAGLLLTLFASGSGLGLMIVGALLLVSLGLEARYGRPGAPTDVPHTAWERTGERFLDDETGSVLEVWIDPLTGERRYEPEGADIRLSHRR